MTFEQAWIILNKYLEPVMQKYMRDNNHEQIKGIQVYIPMVGRMSTEFIKLLVNFFTQPLQEFI